MRPTSYQSEDLDRLLRKHKIATLDDLKAVLGTDVDSTVFRKLNELAYRTSYSHRGSYYTLDEIALCLLFNSSASTSSRRALKAEMRARTNDKIM